MQLSRLYAPLLILLLLSACRDPAIEPDNADENSSDQTAQTMSDDFGPVTDCDETLSAFELRELWEMSNAKVYHERHICFDGFVVSNETYGDLIQGSIAFEPFTEEDVVIPSVLCEFSGLNGITFMDYEVGSPIHIMGKLVSIDNSEKHNFKFVKCSLPGR